MPVQRAVGLYLVQGGAQGGHAGVLLSVHHAGLQGAVELQEGHRRGGGAQGFHHLQIDRAVLYPDVQPLHIGGRPDLPLAVGEVAVAAVVVGGHHPEPGLGGDLLKELPAEVPVQHIVGNGGVVKQIGDGEHLDVGGEGGQSAVRRGAAGDGPGEHLLHGGGRVPQHAVGIELHGVLPAGGLLKGALKGQHRRIRGVVNGHITDHQRGGIGERQLEDLPVLRREGRGAQRRRQQHAQQHGNDSFACPFHCAPPSRHRLIFSKIV